MENATATSDTISFLHRHSPRGGQLYLVFIYSFLLSQLCSGCERERHGPDEAFGYEEKQDSLSLSFFIERREGFIIPEHIDLFLYETEGLKRLILHRRLDYDGNGSFELRIGWEGGCGTLTAATVVDCPLSFNDKAIAVFSAFEAVRYRAEDDNPARPVMSDMSEFSICDGSGRCTLRPRPLWSRLDITEIHNSTGVRLESPTLYLSLCNPEAELFRAKGFRALEQKADTVIVPLPSDLGLYAQYPDISLWAYPNDNENEEPGCERTTLNMSCLIRGMPYSCSAKLPPLPRDVVTHCILSIEDSGSPVPGIDMKLHTY